MSRPCDSCAHARKGPEWCAEYSEQGGNMLAQAMRVQAELWNACSHHETRTLAELSAQAIEQEKKP